MTQWRATASILTVTPLGPVVVGSLTAALSDHHGQVTYRIPGLWLQFDVETEDRTGACRTALDHLATTIFPLLPGTSLTNLQIIVHQPTRTRPQAA